ncbi:MAG: hypothetical protein WCK49_02085 [Myxococcaceae bacterium]
MTLVDGNLSLSASDFVFSGTKTSWSPSRSSGSAFGTPGFHINLGTKQYSGDLIAKLFFQYLTGLQGAFDAQQVCLNKQTSQIGAACYNDGQCNTRSGFFCSEFVSRTIDSAAVTLLEQEFNLSPRSDLQNYCTRDSSDIVWVDKRETPNELLVVYDVSKSLWEENNAHLSQEVWKTLDFFTGDFEIINQVFLPNNPPIFPHMSSVNWRYHQVSPSMVSVLQESQGDKMVLTHVLSNGDIDNRTCTSAGCKLTFCDSGHLNTFEDIFLAGNCDTTSASEFKNLIRSNANFLTQVVLVTDGNAFSKSEDSLFAQELIRAGISMNAIFVNDKPAPWISSLVEETGGRTGFADTPSHVPGALFGVLSYAVALEQYLPDTRVHVNSTQAQYLDLAFREESDLRILTTYESCSPNPSASVTFLKSSGNVQTNITSLIENNFALYQASVPAGAWFIKIEKPTDAQNACLVVRVWGTRPASERGKFFIKMPEVQAIPDNLIDSNSSLILKVESQTTGEQERQTVLYSSKDNSFVFSLKNLQNFCNHLIRFSLEMLSLNGDKISLLGTFGEQAKEYYLPCQSSYVTQTNTQDSECLRLNFFSALCEQILKNTSFPVYAGGEILISTDKSQSVLNQSWPSCGRI